MLGIKSSPLSLSVPPPLQCSQQGGRGNRTGLPALCSTAAGLTLTGIMADSHHTWEEGRNEKEMEAENCRNGLNQLSFTADLSAQMPVYTVRKHQQFQFDQMSKSLRPLCSGWCNGDMTWTDSHWMIRQWLFAVFAGASVCFLNTLSCCHSFSSWVEHWSTLDKSCCPLLMCSADRIRPLLSSCYQMLQLHTLVAMIYHFPVSLPGLKHDDMFIENSPQLPLPRSQK